MEKILEYRKKHPRCRYCKYNRIVPSPSMMSMGSYHECKLKDKFLNDSCLLWNIKGCFCKWFEPEEGEK